MRTNGATTGCLCVLLLAVVGLSSARSALSPALSLQEALDAAQRFGYDKRSPLNLKRHVSPSMDVEDNLAQLRTLINVGKRAGALPASELDGDLQMLSRLDAVGKRSSALAPGGGDFARRLDLLSHLSTVGKRAFSPSVDFNRHMDMLSILSAAGRKRGVSPSLDLHDQLQLGAFLDQAGRRR